MVDLALNCDIMMNLCDFHGYPSLIDEIEECGFVPCEVKLRIHRWSSKIDVMYSNSSRIEVCKHELN